MMEITETPEELIAVSPAWKALTPAACEDFRMARSLSMKRTWELLREGLEFSDARRRAWAEGKKICLEKYGANFGVLVR